MIRRAPEHIEDAVRNHPDGDLVAIARQKRQTIIMLMPSQVLSYREPRLSYNGEGVDVIVVEGAKAWVWLVSAAVVELDKNANKKFGQDQTIRPEIW